MTRSIWLGLGFDSDSDLRSTDELWTMALEVFPNRVVLKGEGEQEVFFPFDFAIGYKRTITKGGVHKEQITKHILTPTQR